MIVPTLYSGSAPSIDRHRFIGVGAPSLTRG
jgi:hypothetical protein